MPIRPVDLQTMIPKLPEVQKARSAEYDNSKNSFSINMQKEQQKFEVKTKKVNETKGSENPRIDREGKQKNRQQGNKKSSKEDEGQPEGGKQPKEAPRKKNTIDIRI